MTKLSGGLNNWYVVPVKNPQRKDQDPYQAECEDIIQALGMTFDEGCAFKALWRNAAARMGNGKPGNTAVYDSEKLVHYANRILAKERVATIVAPFLNPEETIFAASKRQTTGSDIQRVYAETGGNNGWVYSNSAPIFTKRWISLELVFRTEKPNQTYYCGESLAKIRWEDVVRYRINYA